MSSSRRFSLVIAAVALIGGGFLWHASLPSVTSERAPDAPETLHEGPPEPAVVSTFVASSTTRPVRAAPPVPAELRDLLPSLTEDVVDWRRFRPERFSVQLAPGLVVPFRTTAVDDGTHRTVLTARLDRLDNAPSDLDAIFLVGTANRADAWRAVIAFNGIEYHIDVEDGRSTIVEAPLEDLHCEPEVPLVASEELWPPVSAPDPAATEGEQLVVDVLFLYDAQALADHGGRTHAIDADCANYIAQSNAVLSNTRISRFRWRYLGAVQTPESPSNASLADDLRDLRPGGALASFVEQLKVQRKFDQLVYLTGGVKTGGVGIAAGGPPFLYSAVNYPHPTTSSGTRSPTRTSFFVVCHELGHNFGCRHDRADPASTANLSPGAYAFGYRFTDTTNGTTNSFGTIMAIGAVRVPYFSNPDIDYRGQPIGVAIGQPDSAHNAWALSQRSPLVAGASDATGLPVITRHPTSVTVANGQSVTLSVAAAGEGIMYVWAKDGSTIPGAEGPSYTITNANAASSGVYLAAALNAIGSTTSNQATVTVTGLTPSPPASGGSSGGGGGGGSFEGGWSLILFVAAGLRLALWLHGAQRGSPRD